MSLTRKMLRAMEIDEEKISQIFDAHQDTINEIAKERDSYKEQAEKSSSEVQVLREKEKELAKANAKLELAQEIEAKYKDLQKEFADFKAEIDDKTIRESKAKAYKELLSIQGIPEKYHDTILKVTDLETVKLEEGKLANSKELSESIDKEWADFKVAENKQGAYVPNPPSNNGGTTFEKMSLADKMAYANENPNADEVKAWLK